MKLAKAFCIGLVQLAIAVAGATSSRSADSFPVTNDRTPDGWSGPVFDPSFSFPVERPAPENLPWAGIDFKVDPERYMSAVLAYVLEGMDRDAWDAEGNPVRRWYHAPWMHEGSNGREFVRGLTRERSSRKGELGTGQTRCYQNWAVSITNPLGGYTYGQVWNDGSRPPDPRNAQFAEGVVMAKLLFTQAPEDEVPMLRNAPTWMANVVRPTPGSDACPASGGEREVQAMRLLQFDVAVSHPLSEASTGWVYGTFVYDGSRTDDDPWDRLAPVGLMWGNDPELSDADAANGRRPVEGIVLSDFGLGRAFGRGGRMNGPVDNPSSACLSCHMTAQYPSAARMAPPENANPDAVMCWFRNLRPGEAFGSEPGATASCGAQPPSPIIATGTSLQLAMGLRAYSAATSATLPTMPDQPTPEGAMDVLTRSALVNWLSQSLESRAALLDAPLVEHGLPSFPVTRGD
ncbi:MAG TPA: hypothetical protein VGN97_03275 [Mesorhizobium sp.]|jgi:hypothetical protein|nr:hypothetical protein [Mesorhizobium sp.]